MLDRAWGGLNWPHDQRVLLSILERYRGRDEVVICELGVDKGQTGNRLVERLVDLGVNSIKYYGIDDMSLARYEPTVDHHVNFDYDCMTFIEGNRSALKGIGPLDFLFIDGCHCSECVYEDSIAGSRASAVGGVMAFHDTCLMVQYPNSIRPNAWQHYVSGVPTRPLAVVEGIATARASWLGTWTLIEQSGDRLDWGGIRAYLRTS